MESTVHSGRLGLSGYTPEHGPFGFTLDKSQTIRYFIPQSFSAGPSGRYSSRPRRDLPGGCLRAHAPLAVGAAGGDDSFGAVYRRAGEYGDAGAVSALPYSGCDGKGYSART